MVALSSPPPSTVWETLAVMAVTCAAVPATPAALSASPATGAPQSCQPQLELVGPSSEGGGQVLRVLPAGAGCRCASPRLVIDVCDTMSTPCEKLEGELHWRRWRAVSALNLSTSRLEVVQYAGWYGVLGDSFDCMQPAPLWVDGLRVASWNVTKSDQFVVGLEGEKESDKDNDDEDDCDDDDGCTTARGRALCLSVLVVDQFDPSTILNVAFPWLRVCLRKVNCTGQGCRQCRTVPFPQRSAELFCGRNGSLTPGDRYRISVSPDNDALCASHLRSCPTRAWFVQLPVVAPQEVTQVKPVSVGPVAISCIFLGVAVAIAAVAAIAVVLKRFRGRQTVQQTEVTAPLLQCQNSVSRPVTVLLAAPAQAAVGRAVRHLRLKLQTFGVDTLSLQDRAVMCLFQRHPSLADALGRPPLQGAMIVFVGGEGEEGGDDEGIRSAVNGHDSGEGEEKDAQERTLELADGATNGVVGGVQQRLFLSLLQYVRGSPLACNYRRVFAVAVGDTVLDPLLADVSRGRLFRVDDSAELVRHLLAAAAAPAGGPDITGLCKPDRQNPPENEELFSVVEEDETLVHRRRGEEDGKIITQKGHIQS
ncbi:uncharacterized protein LOC122369234 isoform X1 [Amphibalanus amphitrite]|uniref:uncharacterized protein LOC122369234 isoform X1 n=1 Tax=Amphibalanus amphitrite TaxID=1232801 RepID=UPI001C92A933|nr:uncharacterized protein LOC122369234 isoform X1 [Amphibalanus amphitrite]